MSVVGFIGLGTMGAPMARNLLKAGHRLVVHARRPEVLAEFRQAGAQAVETPAAVAAAAEFVITIVPVDRDVEEVVLGKSGIRMGAAPGKMLIEMSTISPTTVGKLHAGIQDTGMSLLDAPVSGGPSGARQGTLSIMVGGSDEDVRRAEPILKAMGEKVIHVGPLGAGQTVKVVNQMMAGGIMALVGEAFVLARAAGADLERFAEVVSISSGNSAMFAARKNFVLNGNYEPAFRTELMRKDVGLALDMAKQLGVPLPLAAAAFQQYTTAVKNGYAGLDFASVAKVCEQAAGITIAQTNL